MMSKRKEGNYKSESEWRSLDELKAIYIANLQCETADTGAGKPYKVTLEGKTVWKVPVYQDIDKGQKMLKGYVYVDLTTGKSKGSLTGFNKWSTLKEVDEENTKIYQPPTPFKDALRNLYPE